MGRGVTNHMEIQIKEGKRLFPTIVILRVLVVMVSTGEPNQSSLENIKCKGSQMNITLNEGSKDDLISKNIPSGHI